MNKRIKKKKAKQEFKRHAESFYKNCTNIMNADILGKTASVEETSGGVKIRITLTEKGKKFFDENMFEVKK